MKIRQGFVSNSSSSSFVVAKNLLTKAEINAIMNYGKDRETADCWNITQDEDYITGDTFMCNDDFPNFIEELGINKVRFTY